jgi:transcriptional regulator with XRE-family HTH domain
MDIKSVIQRHGYQLQAVSGQMNVKHSTLSGMLSGNPTISTLRKIADSINAMNKEKGLDDRCYLAEFFADELPADYTLQSTAQPAAEPASEAPEQPAASAEQQLTASEQQAGGQQSEQEELPFGQQQPAASEQQPQGTTLVGLVRCPQCGRAIRLFAEE